MPVIFDTLPVKRIEADLPEAEGRTASTRMASWMRFKSFFPNITAPVFHATSGPRAAMIALRGEGIKSESGYSNFGGQSGISLSRDLSFLLKGGFGNVIFVLDYQSLARRFDVTPIQHPGVGDEFEERVYTDLIPTSMIRGVIINATLLNSISQEWVESVDYPVVHLSKDRTTWIQAGLPLKTATLSNSEKEEREDKRLIQKSPEKKPPRQDLRRRTVKDPDSREDPDVKQDKKDRSKNYKDASLIKRIVTRHLAVRVARQKGKKSEEEDNRVKFLKLYGTKKVKNPVSGREVLLSTLSSKTNRGEEREYEVYEKEYQKWLETQKKKEEPSQEELPQEEPEATPEEGASSEDEPALDEKTIESRKKGLKGLADALASASGKQIDKAYKALVEEHPDLKEEVNRLRKEYDQANSDVAKAALKGNKADADIAEKKRADAIKKIKELADEPQPEEDLEEEPEVKPEPKPEVKPKTTPVGRKPKSLPKGKYDRVELEAPEIDVSWGIGSMLSDAEPKETSPEDFDNLVDYQNVEINGDSEQERLDQALASFKDDDARDNFKKVITRVKAGNFDMPIMLRDKNNNLLALSGQDEILASKVLGKPIQTVTLDYKKEEDSPDLEAFDLQSGKVFQQVEDVMEELENSENSYELGSMLENMKANRKIEVFKELDRLKEDGPITVTGRDLTARIKDMQNFFDKKRSKDAKIDPKELALNIYMMQHLTQAGDPKEIESGTEEIFESYPIEEREAQEAIEKMNVFDRATFNENFKGEYDGALKEAQAAAKSPSVKTFAEKVKRAKAYFSEDFRGNREPREAAKYAAVLAAENKINNPIDRFKLGEDVSHSAFSSPEEKEKALVEATKEAFDIFKDASRLSKDTQDSYIEKLTSFVDSTAENSPARIKAQSALNAVRVAQIANTPPNEDVDGVSNVMSNAIRAAYKTGEVAYFLDQTRQFDNPEDAQEDLVKNVSRIYKNLSDEDFLAFATNESPFGDLAEKALGPRSNASRAEREFIRESMQEYMLGNMRFVGGDDEDALSNEEVKRSMDYLKTTKPNTPQNRSKIKSGIESLNKLLAKLFKKRNEESTLDFTPSVSRVASRYFRGISR